MATTTSADITPNRRNDEAVVAQDVEDAQNTERESGDQIGLMASQMANETRRGLVPAEDSKEVRRGLVPATDSGVPNDAAMKNISEPLPVEPIDNAAGMVRGDITQAKKVTSRQKTNRR